MDTCVVIKNAVLEAHVLLYGATLKKLIYKGVNVVLGYETEAEYRKNGGYLGATVGRYANRIADGKFILDGIEYDVGCNETGRGHLHGGVVGLDKRIFTPVKITADSLTLAVKLKDGEEGYPGNMEFTVTYTLDGSSLLLTYEAVSDKTTVFNPTNHSYFNLSGGGTILDHTLRIDADEFVPVDSRLIPLEHLYGVENTPFDFRAPKPIGKDINANHEQLKVCGGYDHTFVMCGEAVLSSPVTGITMSCSSDMPGLQVYSGNFLHDAWSGFENNCGIALETGFYPNSPNRPDFPSPVIRAGERFRSVTTYKFI